MTIAYNPIIDHSEQVSLPQVGNKEWLLPTKGKRAFIASPMSGFSDDALYKQNRKVILGLASHLSVQYGFENVYFAGENLASKEQFNSSTIALERDMSELEQSDIFIFVYPDKILSSVLIEAGYAMALRKPMLILVREKKDLPYLLQEAEKTGGSSIFPRIEIRLYEDEDSLKQSIDDSILQLFDERA
ncbi:MAG: nucleoside 2-deoxyribosyltransferase [Crocosphaera sp.]|nr:nucleoside 2-deoxyribosyltransferase [Crocosphaera sp.]